MRTPTLFAGLSLLVAVDFAAGQAPSELRKGDNVRVWSAHRRIIAQNGWIESIVGPVLSLRVPAEAHLETDALYTTLALDTTEVDTIEVQKDGLWWRANFSGRPFVAIDPRSRMSNLLERVPLYTRVRVWAPESHLDGRVGVLVNSRVDSIDVHFAPGSAVPPVTIPTAALDRLQIPRPSLGYTTGMYRGAIAGAVGGVIVALATESCTSTNNGTANGTNCAAFSGNALPYGAVGAAVGAVLGAGFAWWTRGKWQDVAIPGR